MFRIILLEPEIPQNTGNIARLCASTGIELVLVGRLGFSIDDKHLKRAAMDYWEYVNVKHIKTLDGAGFPNFVYEKYTDRLYRIPMKTESRSLNLSSSAAIVSYHLLYKLNFPNLF